MSAESSSEFVTPTIVSWEEGIGDERRYHVAHVSHDGVTLVLKEKEHSKWQQLVDAAQQAPEAADELLRQQPKAKVLLPEQLAKVTYTQELRQLVFHDVAGKKISLPEGKEQAEIFAAVKSHLPGEESEEEADAWSVMQSPLFVLAVIGVIGGFAIGFTTICEAEYEATGRRQGMKQLLNWLGYSIGPFWMSVAVGSLAALVLGMMIYQLIKRPIRQVLTYTQRLSGS